jgi:threonine dehydrogenase-like Zn-dependent dehydrogenase
MASDNARAFWVTGPGRGEIRPESVPEPGDGDVVVRTLYSAISRGTEVMVFNGAVPRSEYQRMRAPFQAGDFPAPVKYGYINVGLVERGPEALEGRTVFCLYPHQTRYVVPAEAVHVVPDNVPAARAVLAAYMETAVNGLWDALPRVGDRVAVVGAGTLGCLVAWLASNIAGCRVELVDIEPGRRRAAEALGVDFAEPPDAAPEADLVLHASGTQDGLATALGLAGIEATVLELSWFGDQRIALPLGEAFHSRRLILRSSQVGAVAASQRPRWTVQRRMRLVLELLAAPELDVLITGEHPFDELPAVLARLSEAAGQPLCHRIVYRQR